MSNEAQIFHEKLKFNSENVFLKSEKHSLTFKEFRSFSLFLASEYKKLNLPSQSLVLVDIRDPFYLSASVFALFHLKLRPALLNYYFKKPQVDEILKNNSYAAFLTDQKDKDQKTVFVDSTQAFHFNDGDLDIDLLSEIIFFTSGSIRSKACVLKLENFLYNALGSSHNLPFQEKDTWGLCLPLFHVGGFSIIARAILASASIAILDNNTNYQEQLHEFKVTHASFVSTQFMRFLDQFTHLPLLKSILLGGSAIPELTLSRALECGLPIYKSYGMTEMASQICTTQKLTSHDDFSLSGHVLNYRDLKIIDKKIFVKGPCLFQGYLHNDSLEKPFDKEGWFLTGDNGEIHHKEVQILGRSDRVFQSAGENISPELIEQELLRIPGVLKAYVKPEPDSEYGLRAVAYIEKSLDLKNDAILASLEKKLSGLYRPKQLRSWTDLPKTSWKQ